MTLALLLALHLSPEKLVSSLVQPTGERKTTFPSQDFLDLLLSVDPVTTIIESFRASTAPCGCHSLYEQVVPALPTRVSNGISQLSGCLQGPVHVGTVISLDSNNP